MSALLGPVGRGLSTPSFRQSLDQFFTGTPGRFEQRSNLGPQQQPIFNQLTNAAQNEGAGGAFGDVADYYRNLISSNPQALQAMVAPELRNFNENIVPGISEQFAGMGSFGALNSSGFRNSQLRAGTDLAERIANIRAGLQQRGAEGLQNIGQQSLGNYFSNLFHPRTPGFLESAAPAIGAAATAGASGGLSALIPFLMQLLSGKNNQTGIPSDPQSNNTGISS